MSERLLPETVTAMRRAERRWLDQARDRLRHAPERLPVDPAAHTEDEGTRR